MLERRDHDAIRQPRALNGVRHHSDISGVIPVHRCFQLQINGIEQLRHLKALLQRCDTLSGELRVEP